MIQSFWFQHWKTSFPNIRWLIRKPSSEMRLLIPLSFIRASLPVTPSVMITISRKLISLWMQDRVLKIRIIPLMKMVFPVALTTLLCLWNPRAVNQTYEAVYQLSSLSVQKWNGSMTRRLEKHIANVFVKTRALPPNAVAWYTYILKRTFVLIPGQSVEPKNGMIPIKSGL